MNDNVKYGDAPPGRHVRDAAQRVLAQQGTGPVTGALFATALERARQDLTSTAPLPLVTAAAELPGSAAARRGPALYLVIVAAWLGLCAALAAAGIPVERAALGHGPAMAAAVTLTIAFIAYFWLNGVKDVAYPLAYRLVRHRLPPETALPASPPLVGLLYVTCNDFSAEALLASAQDYPRCRLVILDDSWKPEYLARVDAFARQHGVPVVRRPDRVAFKAGNLNNYLRTAAGQQLDYFVIIDADEILPPEFTRRCLDYFRADPGVGGVQANHVATRNRTTFMRTFAPGVDAHWPAYQAVKARFGFMSLLGHGAMISREAYNAAGGFPPVVAEDICFAIDAREAGYRIAFAPDITCEEEFPPDYAAFKKRHRKWTEGNMEFIRAYSRRILLGRRLTWYEKLDIVLFTYSLPLTSVFSVYVLLNAVIFPMTGFRYHFPLWMLAPTVTFLLAPMMNDALTFARRPKGALLSYLGQSVLLFGSVYFASLFASVRTTFGRSVFHVTPKTSRATSLVTALRQNLPELAAGTVLGALVAVASGSVLPVILILIPVIFTVYLSVMNSGDSDDPADGRHILQEEE